MAASAKEQAVYSHGHHSSVVSHHARRTAKDSAAFLVPHLSSHPNIKSPSFKFLDLGCGPGTITADFAQIISEHGSGTVLGVDAVESVLVQAREHAKSRSITNIEFKAVDANALPFQDGEFDVVFCHQVLQHVKNPVQILKEMKRVAKKDGHGIVAAREADYKTFAWSPELPGLTKWAEIYQAVAMANGGEPNAGRHIRRWARDAGFASEDITSSWSTWFYIGQDAKAWSQSWEGRAKYSDFATSVVKHGLATKDELQAISATWVEWATDPDAFIAVPNGEIFCKVRP